MVEANTAVRNNYSELGTPKPLVDILRTANYCTVGRNRVCKLYHTVNRIKLYTAIDTHAALAALCRFCPILWHFIALRTGPSLASSAATVLVLWQRPPRAEKVYA